MINAPGPGRGLPRRLFLRRSGLAVVGGGLWLSGCGDDAQTSSTTTTTGAPPESSTTVAGGSTTSTSVAPTTTVFDGPATDIRYQLSWIKDSENSGLYHADAEGLYADAGINFDLLSGGPQGPYPEQVIAGGAAEMGSASGFTFIATAIQAGTDLVVIGAQGQENPACLVSLPDNPVETLADLVGKKVGTDPGYEALLESLLASAGLEPDIDVVPVGSDSAALLAGDCEVLVGFVTNQPVDLELQGVDHVVLKFGDIGFPGYSGVVVTSRSFLDANRDAVVRFMDATLRGWDVILADPARGAQLTVDDYGADLGLEYEKSLKSLEATIGLMTSPATEAGGLFYLDPDQVAGPIYDAQASIGLTGLPDPTGYIDLSVLDDVQALRAGSA